MNTPEWLISDDLVDYPQAVALMEQRVGDIRDGKAPELVWFLEHPPLYTAGCSARPQDLLSPDRFPVYASGRGGQYTYHGPGQRVVYVMLDLKARNLDVHAFVHGLEEWLILTLGQFNLKGERLSGLTGVWVKSAFGWRKIAALGVRVRRWVSFHGIALNLDPDLSHFQGIVPCGIRDYGVTSLWEEGLTISLVELDMALKESFAQVF